MKTIYFLIATFFMAPLLSFTTLKTDQIILVTQDTITVEATFDGHEDYGYNFIAKHNNGEEYTITFQEVEEPVSKEFDLKSEVLIGAMFKITYKTETIVTKDADGYEDENIVNTITKLEKI